MFFCPNPTSGPNFFLGTKYWTQGFGNAIQGLPLPTSLGKILGGKAGMEAKHVPQLATHKAEHWMDN